MLKVKYIRNNTEIVKKGLLKRNWSPEEINIVDEVLLLDEKRKSIQHKKDQLLSEIKTLSKQIGGLMQSGKKEQVEQIKASIPQIKKQIKTLDEEGGQVYAKLEEHLLSIPNVPHDLVPPGKTEEDNYVYKDWTGPMPELPEDALPHWELAERYGLFDFKLGVKLTGSGFPVYRGKGARLERALINFFLDQATTAGYEEIWAPLMVNAASARATGQLPDKEGQMYHICKDDLYMIPTAEVPLTNIYRDVILKETDFPIKLTGYTPCFRREAGSYGAHVKGLNRVHQFDKVEIVQLQHPDHSWETLDSMVKHVSHVLDRLELPYRIVRLCGGDLGFTSAMTYDFEVYSAAQKKWLEVSSVSNFLTFQSNRLKLRFKDKEGKIHLAHTLNGSALALARIMASLLENNQTPKGIVIPEKLRPFTGFDIIQ